MSDYPLSTNHFQVQWGGERVGFTEVSGLSIEIGTIKDQSGETPDQSPAIMPSQPKTNNIILKRGISRGDNEFLEWFNTVKHNTIKRRNILISLLDEEHNSIINWKIKNAFPVKIEWSNLRANANEPAIESIEIRHEGMVVEHN